ncbi:transcriptional regulator, MarR family [Lachnospiraceae bacterium KM106-2]|nr:transcriptional regulator, MarR family [Lachnospiraceae bacterium KM106-2]
MEANAKNLRESVRLLERNLGMLNESDCSVTLSQCHAIVEIGRNQPLMLKMLANRLQLDVSTMSKTVDHLVKRNLVERKQSDEDRRKLVLTLTKEGRLIYQKVENNMELQFQQLLEKIPVEQRELVLEGLTVLNTALNPTKNGGEEQ